MSCVLTDVLVQIVSIHEEPLHTQENMSISYETHSHLCKHGPFDPS